MFTARILVTGVSGSLLPLPVDTMPVLLHVLFVVGRVDEPQEAHTLFDRLVRAAEHVQA